MKESTRRRLGTLLNVVMGITLAGLAGAAALLAALYLLVGGA